ncbi:MAG: hypothetical protein NT135_01085 [Candidatus Berkelbacteria bacterium]|nr:hypothetical protein [Candidatus Berkelbacteria bacterium]
MFSKKDPQTASFYGVALMLILIGIGIFAYGMAGWLYNTWTSQTCWAFPSIKVMGGLIIMALGYIQLELELLRKK